MTQHRNKRELPPGLSKRDTRILRSVKQRAHYLDKGFHFCGLRFGWTFFIGLIPVVGDATDAFLNYYLVVRKAKQAELPGWLVQRMLLNNAISAGVGFIPLVGDVVLAVYKANSRNAALLEEFLRVRGEGCLDMSAAGAAAVIAEPGGSRVTAAGAGTGAAAGTASLVAPQKKKKTGSLLPRRKESLTASDVQQVKPGAGMTGSELQLVMKDPEAAAVQAAASAQTGKGGAELSSAPSSGHGVGTTSGAPVERTASKKSSPGLGSRFSFFGSKSKKASTSTAATDRTNGRFVEHLDS